MDSDETGQSWDLRPASLPLVPKYTTTPVPQVDAGKFLEQLRQPITDFNRPSVVLVAWGNSPANAAAAMVRGGNYAKDTGYRVLHTVASHSPRMSDALLFRFTVDHFERHEVDYGAAWWLVHHSAITSRDLDEARAALKRMGAIEDEFAAFQAEHGFPPDAVTLGSERADQGYPFPRSPRVADRPTRVPGPKTSVLQADRPGRPVT